MKTIRTTYGNKQVVGFTNGLISYGKNIHGKYIIEVNFLQDLTIPIYIGNSKPIFRNICVLRILFYLFSPIVILAYIFWELFLEQYLEGAKNFITGSRCVDGVAFFNWMNIVFSVILLTILLLR